MPHHYPNNQPIGHDARHVASHNRWNPVHWVNPNPREHTNMHQRAPVLPQVSPQLNAFQEWRQRHPRQLPQYSTIDGGKHDPDFELRPVAEDLRTSTKDEVLRIVGDFRFSHEYDQKACLDLVRKTPIFPGLVAYTYTHLVMCRYCHQGYHDYRASQLSELKRLVRSWEKDGDVCCILECDARKGALLKILNATKVGPGEHRCNSALLNGAMILKTDILNLASLVVLCITEERTQATLGRLGGKSNDTKRLVELLHNLLESNVKLVERYRRCFLNFLIPFSKETGCCPRSFYIRGDAIRGLEQKYRGGFGEVSRGTLGSRESRLVAVKTPRRDDLMKFSDYPKLISREAIVWRYLRHPNCLPLYGLCLMREGTGLVSPWMEKGTLDNYLKNDPSPNRTKLILDVVRGLEYLHTMEPHVAHRDIKPNNVLVTSEGRACLADFGLASVFDTINDNHTHASDARMGGTPYYMAPEIFKAIANGKKRSVNKRACDMYALGCTIYEVYTGRAPFDGFEATKIAAMVTSGQRPRFPVGTISADMWSFVENLWVQDPTQRLTAKLALEWMEVKASNEGIDLRLPTLIKGWKGTGEFWFVSGE